MKFTGKKLLAKLAIQVETVLLVFDDGRELHSLSPRYVAGVVAEGVYTGHGKNGVITAVIAQDAPRRVFAMAADIAKAAAGIPLAPRVTKNRQDPGAKKWAAQPVFAKTGQGSRISTIFRGVVR